MNETMEAKWYVIRTFSGNESKVKKLLDAEIAEDEDIQAKIKEVLIPKEKLFQIKKI